MAHVMVDEGENSGENEFDEEEESDDEEVIRHCRGCGFIINENNGYVVCSYRSCSHIYHNDPNDPTKVCHGTSYTDGKLGRKKFVCKTCLRS